MEDNKTHTVSYRTNLLVLFSLIILTFITVAATHVRLGAWNVTVALLIACTKAGLVLTWFMHLKFDNKLFRIMVGIVLAVFIAVILLTFLDYLFR